MLPIKKFSDVVVGMAMHQIETNASLFDLVTVRQEFEGTAHKDTKSIFLRSSESFGLYKRNMQDDNSDALLNAAFSDAFNNLDKIDMSEYSLFPTIRYMVESLYKSVDGSKLGGVVIVKLHPDGKIDDHIDEGRYAEYYDRYHIALESPINSAIIIEGEKFHLMTGEAWKIDHRKVHCAENIGSQDRIHIIVDIK